MAEIKAIIFDLDGTLYPVKRFAFRLVFSSLKNMMIMKDERDIRNILRTRQFNSEDELIDEFALQMDKKGHIKKEDFKFWYYNTYQDLMTNVLKKHYPLRKEVDVLFPYLIEHNVKYSFLSDYPKVKEKLLALNFKQEYLDHAVSISSSEMFGQLKPNSKPFLELVKQFNEDKENCLMVGDKFSTDIQGSINSNLPYIQIIENMDDITKPYQKTFASFVDYIMKEIK